MVVGDCDAGDGVGGVHVYVDDCMGCVGCCPIYHNNIICIIHNVLC